MNDLLRNFDRLSFWLGFLAASLFWLLIGWLRPAFAQMREKIRQQAVGARQERTLNDEIRLGNDTLHMSQSWHLAAAFFSLDEILVPPRLLAPAPLPMAYEPPPSEDITDWAIPTMPDWPELASYYGAPWLEPVEALQGGANLAIIGKPGSGKTVTLAYLARQFIRNAPELGQLSHLTPVMVHAADLILPPPSPNDLLSSLHPALFSYVKSIPQKRLPLFLHTLFNQGRALLLIDGLDELSPTQMSEVTGYLKSLLEKYSHTRAVVAAAPDHLGDLPMLGFIPVSVTSWSAAQRALFITHWGDLWEQFIAKQMPSGGPAIDTLLILGWLLNNTQNLTPLELTLKTWAAFAGDSLGPAPQAALEAFVRRMLVGQPGKNRQALEQLAGQIILNVQPIPSQKQAENWLGGSEMAAQTAEKTPQQKTERSVRARGALPDLLESGLLVKRRGDRISVQHPVLTGYLAAQSSAVMNAGEQIAGPETWTGREIALNYLAMIDSQASWLENMLDGEDTDLLQRNLLLAARWLRNAPAGLPWISAVMRQLAERLQNNETPLALRARVLTAMVICSDPGVAVMLRNLVTSDEADVRQLAALGLGFLRDLRAIQDLIHLLDDRRPAVNRSAILALTAIGDKTSLEAVASLLLSGDDSKRKAVAQALTNQPEEGYPTLEEGSTLSDPAVRRAVVYGLGRVRQPWAIAILEKLRKSDPQWVVKDAASQMLSAIQDENPRLPRPIPPLTETAWLTAFAAERGMGVAPGKPAYELLYRALAEGNEDQRQAAVYYLSGRGDEGAILPLYQIYFSSRGELREMVFTALWYLAATGLKLPPPTQFGLR
jgi:HEAT repeat protein